MVGYGGGVAKVLQKPSARGLGISHGFLGGEGLGSHQKEGAGRVQEQQRFVKVRAVDVGDEVHLDSAVRKGL